jgi:hypothetical protein
MEMENLDGAGRTLDETGGEPLPCRSCSGRPCERACLRTTFAGSPVPIVENLLWLSARRAAGR